MCYTETSNSYRHPDTTPADNTGRETGEKNGKRRQVHSWNDDLWVSS